MSGVSLFESDGGVQKNCVMLESARSQAIVIEDCLMTMMIIDCRGMGLHNLARANTTQHEVITEWALGLAFLALNKIVSFSQITTVWAANCL